jgi:hypothetical protein
MADKKAEKKIIGLPQGLTAIAFFVIAMLLGILAQRM